MEYITAILGFTDKYVDTNVSGYNQNYEVRTRSRTELFIILALFLLVITVVLMFAIKKTS